MFAIISRLPVFYILGILWVLSAGSLLYILIQKWYPENITQMELQSEVENSRKEIIHLIRLNEFAENYSVLKKNLKAYKTRLSAPFSQSDLTEKLFQIASKNRVTVLSESNKKKRKNSLNTTTKSLLVEGKYINVRNYLYDLNKLESMVFIKKIEIKNKKKSHKVKASILIAVYYSSK